MEIAVLPAVNLRLLRKVKFINFKKSRRAYNNVNPRILSWSCVVSHMQNFRKIADT